jgi:hypothetical protein
MKKINKQIPYVYIYIYHSLKKRFPTNYYLKPSDLLEVLKRICRIPKTLHYPIVFQMEECGLIKRINHQRYRILKSDCEKILDKLRVKSFWD